MNRLGPTSDRGATGHPIRRVDWSRSGFRALYGAELRMVVRDRRTLVASVLLPVLVLPLVFWISGRGERQREARLEAETLYYALEGPRADWLRSALGSVADAAAEESEGAETSSRIRLEERSSGSTRGEVDPDPARALAERQVHLWIEAEDGPSAKEEGSPALPRVRLHFSADWNYSQAALAEIERRLWRARADERRQVLESTGIDLSESEVLSVVGARDLASAGQRSGSRLGRWATAFLLFFLLVGGSVVAADTLAGEKERGSLETLLGSAAGRTEIVLAKLAVIFTVGLFILLVQVANLAIYARTGLLQTSEQIQFELSAVGFACLLLLFLPLAALVAAVLLWISGRARSYKEFQIQFFPVALLALVPASAALLPGLELRSAVVLVPVANISVAVREVLVGRFDWPMLLLAFAVSTAAAVATVRSIVRGLESERLITAREVDEAELGGGPRLFPRRVLRWFAVMWATLFLSALALPTIAPGSADLRVQIVINVLGIFFGSSLLMLWRYRLPVRQALRLYPVAGTSALAVALGAPSTFFAAIAVAKLGAWLFPVPQQLVESFGQTLLANELPLWQLLVFVALLPGIFEEVAFRGVLLHGLRDRLSPVALVLTTAAIFAVFHVDLFRLVPTFFLGAVLATVTLLTGSLYPAMAWHVANNALAITLGWAGIDAAAFGPGVYAAALVASAASFWLLWRARPAVLRPGLGSAPGPGSVADREKIRGSL